MSDQTIFDADAAIRRLVKEADEKGHSDTFVLDDIVHDLASAEASDVNNGGTQAQIEYIVGKCGPDGVKLIEDTFK